MSCTPIRALDEGLATPDARYEQRESVSRLIAALQHLPGTQRAALILRDVLGFSARESAEVLETTVASVNGALQRGRKAASERLPSQSQQATLRALGDDGIRDVVERYIDVSRRERHPLALAEDATFSMPLPNWYRGHDAIRTFLVRFPLEERWRLLPARANGQLAFGCYAWDADEGAYTALSLDVLTMDGDRAAEVVSFVTPYTDGPPARDSRPTSRALRPARAAPLIPRSPARGACMNDNGGRAASPCPFSRVCHA